jgi:hypothetical protein
MCIVRGTTFVKIDIYIYIYIYITQTSLSIHGAGAMSAFTRTCDIVIGAREHLAEIAQIPFAYLHTSLARGVVPGGAAAIRIIVMIRV